MTHETDSFVQEVDERLREDRLLAGLRRYGPWLGAAAVAFVLGLLGWQFWNDRQISAGRAHADRYVAAQELARAGNFDAAKTEFERLSSAGPQNYRVMARMEHAALLERQGDLQAALAEFDAAASQARDPILRESAQLRAAYIAADSEDFQALQTRLRPLTESDSRFSYLAKELLAIEAWKAGDLDLARDTLEALSLAFDAQESVRQRAQVALSVIGPAPTTAADGAADAPAPSEGESK